MREAQIILPVGATKPANALRAALCKRFGGCTIFPARGHWVDPADKSVISEAVNCYVVAMEPTPANDAALDEIALAAGVATFQMEVYVRHASGEVILLNVQREHEVDTLPSPKRPLA